MGKRNSNFTGLARFVQQANTASESSPSALEASTPIIAKRPLEPKSQYSIKRQKTRGEGVKQREAGTGAWIEKYDMTGSVQNYATIQDVPDHLKKYYAQRERLFSLFSSPPGCLLDAEGWFSCTPERIANQIAERCRCDTILDAFCGVGGNAIAFAKTCQRVIALDTSPIRLALARHNAQIYGVAQHIEFVLTDYISFANTYLSGPKSSTSRKIDVVFLSPPWGGPSYLSHSALDPNTNEVHAEATDTEPPHAIFSLSAVEPIHGADLFQLSRRISPNIAYYLPRNTNLEEVSSLLGEDAKEEFIEVEEEWMGKKLKALTCYFGGLADGQSDLF
ncbi:hypothetical protein D9757_008885 [Collybiopsis confluens]|uniref:Trimethylguanosine synthase n=1 Tax=Collybiopsis confluens TaxID=2823264 RepID=A0A8H5M166_9AGAR|nr:hypothetical protein D9757_008885 [Collybiopsis confluens]